MKKNIIILALILIASALTACANAIIADNDEETSEEIVVIQADYPFYESAKDIVNSADLIFAGKITDQKYEYLDVKSEKGKDPETGLEKASAIPYTIFEIQVSKMYFGSTDDKTIYIKCPGGKIDDKTYISEMTKNLKPEIEYLFLAKSFKNTYPSLINDTQSFYDLNDKDNTELNEILKIIG